MPVVIPEMTSQQQAEAVISTESREHERQRKAGDRVFLISATWFATWCEYTGHAYDPRQRKLLGNINHNTSDNVFADTIQEEKPSPGPINCSDLLDASPILGDLSSEEVALAAPLRPGLKEKEDFWILHEATWQLLKSWYSCTGPEILREYIPVGGSQRRLEVHHDQWHLKAVDEHSGRTAVIPVLRMSTVAALKDAVCAALDIEVIEEVEVSAFPGMTGEPQTLEDKMLKTLVGAQLRNHQAVLVRRKDHPDVAAAAAAAKRMAFMQTPTSKVPMSTENNDANNSTATTTTAAAPIPTAAGASTALTLPSLTPLASLSPKYKLGTSPANLSSSPLSRSFSKAPSWAEDAIIPSSHRRPGLAGLGNLGNTCFMNSSLQCLVHSMPLIRTFLTGAYRADLNRDNPLGLGGKLAAAFGGLMGKLWQGGVGHVSPKHFKWQLGKFAPQFGGYAQQDSQELLAFLLDGLHEDLNRIQVKPYFEEKDDAGRPDTELAAEAWKNYRARNDSVIVDHFQGLYKSLLRCPGCGRTSVKFDPFMYLSLPLPTPKTRMLTVIVVDAAGKAAPLQVSVEVMKTGSIGDVLKKVAACCGPKEDDKEENATKEDATEGGAPVAQQWLLAQWSPSTGAERLTLFRDHKLPVSSIKEPVKSTFLFSSIKPTTLVAYRFPPSSSLSSSSIPQQGPESGLRPIVIFHKANYTLAGVPTVLYLPTKATAPIESTDAENFGTEEMQQKQQHIQNHQNDQVEELVLERQKTFSSNWALLSPNAIEDGLANFMRPFVKQGVDPKILIKGADSNVSGTNKNAAEPATGLAPMLEGTDPAVAGGENQEDVGMNDAVNEVPTADSDDAASIPELDPLFSTDTDAAAAADGGTTATTGVENMAVDGELRQANMITSTKVMPTAAPETPLSSSAQPGVSFILAKANGDIRSSIAIAPSLGDISSEEPLYFLIEWSDETVAKSLDLTPWTAPVLHESAVNASSAANAPPPSVTLNDCVDAFLQPEKLDASDSWYCTGCKSHVQAEKKLDLWRLPEVLVVHLKRFSYSRYSRDKLDTEVDFPLQGLDLKNVVPIGEGGAKVIGENSEIADASTAMVTEDNKRPNSSFSDLRSPPPLPLYDLYAVSNHYGGLGGGHYTAYCQMPDDSKWYSFDDSGVTEMNPDGVKSPAAYVLFYRRRGAEAQDGDIERVIESARGNGISEDGAGGSLHDVDLFTGGFNGSNSGGQLTPRRDSGQLPALEQVNEEGDEENADIGGSAAVLAVGDDDDIKEQLPALLAGAEDGDDKGMDVGTTEDEARSRSPQHQPSLAAHALPLDDLDDVNMDDI